MALSIDPIQDPRQAITLLRTLRDSIDDPVFEARLKAALAAGYTLLGARDDGALVGVLGYRITHDICWGKTLYVDDLICDPTCRGQGIGGALITAAKDTARHEDCDHIRLCSGLTRTDAHRFYETHALQKFSYQFVQPLNQA